MARQKTPAYAWAIAVGGLVAGLAAIAGPQMWGYVSSYIATQFAVEVTDISWSSSLYNLCCGVFGFAVGMLGDKFGARKLVTLGLVGMGACYIFAGVFDGSYYGPAIFYGLSGFFAAFAMVILLPKLISVWFAPNMRAKGMMLNTIGGTCAGALMGVVLPLILVGETGWQDAFKSVGAVLVLAGVIFFILVRDTPEECGTHAFGYTAEEAEAIKEPELTPEQIAAKKKEERLNVIKVLKYPTTWVFAITLILWFYMFIGAAVYQIPAITAGGFTIAEAGLIGTLTMIANLVSNVVFAPLSDKFASRKVFFAGMLFGGAAIYVIAYFMIGSGTASPAMLYILFFVLGLILCTAPIQQTLYGEVFPPNLRNTGPGVLLMLGTIGSATAPIVAGWWIGAFGGNLVTVFLFAALAAVAAGVIALVGLPATGGRHGDPLLEKYLAEEKKEAK